MIIPIWACKVNAFHLKSLLPYASFFSGVAGTIRKQPLEGISDLAEAIGVRLAWEIRCRKTIAHSGRGLPGQTKLMKLKFVAYDEVLNLSCSSLAHMLN